MKYIRTKDGRIIDLDRIVYGNKVFHLNENEIENNSWSGWYWYTEEYGYELECRDLDILKQSDNIKELCDVFVKKSKEAWNDYFKIGKDFFMIFDKKYHKEDLKHYDYYGAIWTNKGLIYVAKMNDDGELKLL